MSFYYLFSMLLCFILFIISTIITINIKKLNISKKIMIPYILGIVIFLMEIIYFIVLKERVNFIIISLFLCVYCNPSYINKLKNKI